jgi:hypothetical protein
VCEGTGKGLFSSSVIETTEEVIYEVMRENPQLKKPEYVEWLRTDFQTWKVECLRTSHPFWFGYYKSVNSTQMEQWIDEMWQIAKDYRRMLRHKGPEVFVRDLQDLSCRRCPMADLCLGGGEWCGVPDGYVQVPRTEVPWEVLRAEKVTGEDEEEDGDDCPF